MLACGLVRIMVEEILLAYTVIHLFQPDSLELRGHLVMFQSTTLQGQAGLCQELDINFLSFSSRKKEFSCMLQIEGKQHAVLCKN